MNIEALLSQLENSPETLEFQDVIQVIEENYTFTSTDFQCGSAKNTAGTNEGSCKILAFAKLHSINEQNTPYLFGRFYREDVLQHPDGDDHANIRNFLSYGWSGVSFDRNPLNSKT